MMRLRLYLFGICFALLAAREGSPLFAANSSDDGASCFGKLIQIRRLREITDIAISESFKAGPYRAMPLNQYMIDMRLKIFPEYDLRFDFFERYFRLNKVPYFLIAQPKSSLPKSYNIALPTADSESPPHGIEHWLWVGVNGEEEANAEKMRNNLTEEENLLRLRTTGVLVIRDPSSFQTH